MNADIEQWLETTFDRLFPICRSIMGPGFRESLDILAESAPYERVVFKSGAKVHDWTVPPEWQPTDAYLVDPTGKRRAEFKKNNLHLVGYSQPFRGKLPLAELQKHLHSLPDQPTAIPYLTSYYSPYWGFSLTDTERKSLPDGEYEVVVDTKLVPGHLVCGEAVLPGKSKQEVLFSSYLCHPSMGNNELSGPLVLTALYRELAKRKDRRYTYRFTITAETMGTIAFLSKRGKHLLQNLIAGYQLTCCGDRGPLTYKLSRRETSVADRAARLVLRDLAKEGTDQHSVVPFDPAFGSDERQWCSPGYNLPVGSLMRTMYAKFPEYHTSLDDKAFLSFPALARTVRAYERIVDALEANVTWKNTVMFGEPQLGKRNLFRSLGAQTSYADRDVSMWWLLNLCDGTRDLLSVAEQSKCSLGALAAVAQVLADHGLLKEVVTRKARKARK